MIHRQRGNRRWRDHQKAERKQKISRSVFGFDWFKVFGKYDKGKIHCSCHLCRAKTNDGIYGSRNYKPADRRKMEALEEREGSYMGKDYYNMYEEEERHES